MILAVGLTPAWQQIVELEQLRVGEVNRARHVQWCASGKSINVATALASLNVPCHSLSVRGEMSGASLAASVASLGIAADWVEASSSTRICTTIVDSQRHETTELVENALPLGTAAIEALERRYRGLLPAARTIVLSGSLPPDVPRDWYARRMEQTTAPVVLDASGPELLAALAARPVLVKPNRDELARTLEQPIESDAQLVAAMRRVNALGAQWVVVSHGSRAVWVCGANATWRCQPPAIVAVNAIGSGDCLAAGLACGIDQGLPMSETLRLGVACAVENALQVLPARLDADRVRQRAATLVVESIDHSSLGES